MKQNLLFICVALLVTLSGCGNSSKKSEVKEEEEKPFSLAGATYAAYDGRTYSGEEKYIVYWFIDEANLERTLRGGNPQGRIILQYAGTYRLDYPNIHIIYSNGVSEFKHEGFFIKKKTFRRQYRDGTVEEFIKQ